MHPTSCTVCILRAITERRLFDAYRILCRFDPKVGDINSCLGGNTVLHQYLIEHSKTYFIKELMAKGANPDIQNQDGDTSLLVALQNANLEGAKLMLKHGARIGIQNQKGCNALHILLSKPQFVRFMNEAYRESSSAEEIIYDTHKFIVRLAKENPSSLKELALKKLVANYDENGVAKLLEKVPSDLHIPIIIEVFQTRNIFMTQVIERLYRESFFYRTLYREIESKEKEINGALNAQDDHGNTPLHHAAANHADPQLIDLLLQCNASRLIVNKAGKTPYDLANSPCNRRVCVCTASSLDQLLERLNQPKCILSYLRGKIEFLEEKEKNLPAKNLKDAS